MDLDVTSARFEWEEGYRRFAASARDPIEGPRLQAQLAAVTEELRRRIGGTFVLAELAEVYGHSDRWIHEAVSERAPAPGWTRTLTLAGDAAFYLYARGAIDWTP